MVYKFSIYNFTDKEIEQIVTLVKRWANGDTWVPVDARTFTKQVKEYARNWWLLEKRDDGRLYLTKGCRFNPRYDLPPEALWRLVEPMLRKDGATGYSIVNNPLWEKHLGIEVQNSRHASNRDLQEKEDILLELSAHHYIYFQMAGTVWNIQRERQVA